MLNWIRPNEPRTDESVQSESGEEAELVARAKLDRRNFAPLYDRYLDPVYRYCYRRLGSREAAEDATAEIFYKTLTALPGYRDGSFRAWLFTIAHNVVTDAVRRRRPQEPLAHDYDPPDDAATPEQVVIAAEESRSLRSLLPRLPDDQRRVVELRLAGLTGDEIARVLDRSVGAVKMLQSRAVERLRLLLDVRGSSQEVADGKI